MSNRIPEDLWTITMPRVVPDRIGWVVVDSRSPAVNIRAYRLAMAMVDRECGYRSSVPLRQVGGGQGADMAREGCDYGRRWLPWAYCLIDYQSGSGGYQGAPVWVQVGYEHGVLQLARAWVHPHFRGRGLLARAWPALVERLGGTPYVVEPLTPAMAGLLAKVGHVQPEGLPRGASAR